MRVRRADRSIRSAAASPRRGVRRVPAAAGLVAVALMLVGCSAEQLEPVAAAPTPSSAAPASSPVGTDADGRPPSLSGSASNPATVNSAAANLAAGELPGGGRAVFPGRRFVALYGQPGIPPLGALGEQDLPAAIDRVQRLAAEYQPLGTVPVVPTFEIIATIADTAAGADGDYSAELAVDKLRPWVQAASAAGVYVLLDLQPGRSDFLTQARMYEDLLLLPNVGLALDPEWRLQPQQIHLEQIGSVDAAEVNSVISWLDRLTAQSGLPQKLLVLHQFRLSMLGHQESINLRSEHVAVLIQMDGRGDQPLKDQTWQAVTRAAPPGVRFGWKNFYQHDVPVLDPAGTLAKQPTPLLISYE